MEEAVRQGQGCALADGPPRGRSWPLFFSISAPSPVPAWLFPAAPGHRGAGSYTVSGADFLWSWASEGTTPGSVSPSVKWGKVMMD